MNDTLKRSLHDRLVIALTGMICLAWNDGVVSAQEGDPLDWSVTTPSASYHPGQPVRLDFTMRNTGSTAVAVHFGADGIGAFSFELLDSAGAAVASGPKIKRSGLTRMVRMNIAPGESATRMVVLNQWLSTRLPAGKYVLQCYVEPTELERASLEIAFSISTDARTEALRGLEEMAEQALTPPRTEADLAARKIAWEMIAHAEMEEAVPFQVQLLGKAQGTWTQKALIDRLVQAESAEAAAGLVGIIENAHPQGIFSGVRLYAIEAVYKLRDTGKADILQRTSSFVASHPRPPAGITYFFG